MQMEGFIFLFREFIKVGIGDVFMALEVMYLENVIFFESKLERAESWNN